MTLEKACKQLIIKSPFYGIFMMGFNKRFSSEVPTLGVGMSGISCQLLVNKDFWESLNDDQQVGLMNHEALHICFQHIFISSSFDNRALFNIAADLEVNSYIERHMLTANGMFHENFGLESRQGTKYYYEQLRKISQKQNKQEQGEDNDGNGNPEGGFHGMEGLPEDNSSNTGQFPDEGGDGNDVHKNGSLGSHRKWKDFDSMSSSEKRLARNAVESHIKDTVNEIRKSRGTIPSEMVSILDELFKQKKRIYDWKRHFKRLLSNMFDISIKKTRRRESNRFEDAMGIRRKRKTNILVAIDTSASVNDEELCEFFSEINHITSVADVTICECDTAIQNIHKYRKGESIVCHGRGGTYFQPAIEYYNSHREYTSLVYFTDGYGESKIIKPRGNDTVWVVTSNGNQEENYYPGKHIFIPKER